MLPNLRAPRACAFRPKRAHYSMWLGATFRAQYKPMIDRVLGLGVQHASAAVLQKKQTRQVASGSASTSLGSNSSTRSVRSSMNTPKWDMTSRPNREGILG